MDAFPLIISSPSGGGKTTIVELLLQRDKTVKRVITATTRPPRKGERDGIDYHFWTENRFKTAVKNRKMAEWAKVFADFYGVPKASLDTLIKKGITPVLVIDVQGAATVKKHYKNVISVFIMPPDWATLKKRLLAREDGTKDITLRLKTAKKEAACVKDYDFVVINDDLKTAVEDLQKIIFALKSRVEQKLPELKKRKLV